MMATGRGRSSSGEGDVLDRFPAGLRVLVVDDDRTSLKLLEHMLRKCLYEVTVCSESMKALSLLRGSKDSFDIVISDVHMPDMDGYKLLELVGLEMDLPVIMMSGDERTSAVMRGIKHGACDYLIKPVRMQELKTIWQHAVRKNLNIDSKEPGYSGSRELEVSECRNASSNDDESGRLQKKKKKKKKRPFAAAEGKDASDEDGELDNDELSTSKKPRIVWSFDLHQKFCIAVNQLGIDNAVPKRVLELMNVPGLTRENVASHLQKYRISLKRMIHHDGPIEATPTSMLLGRQVVSSTSSTNMVMPPLEHPNFVKNSTQHCHHVRGDGFNQTQLVKCNSNMSDPFFANPDIIALDNVVSSGYSDCWSPDNNFGMTQQQQLQLQAPPSLMIPSTATYQLPIHQNSFGAAGSMTTDYDTLFSSHENFKTSGLLSNVHGSMPGPIIDNDNSSNINSSNPFGSSGF